MSPTLSCSRWNQRPVCAQRQHSNFMTECPFIHNVCRLTPWTFSTISSTESGRTEITKENWCWRKTPTGKSGCFSCCLSEGIRPVGRCKRNFICMISGGRLVRYLWPVYYSFLGFGLVAGTSLRSHTGPWRTPRWPCCNSAAVNAKLHLHPTRTITAWTCCRVGLWLKELAATAVEKLTYRI